RSTDLRHPCVERITILELVDRDLVRRRLGALAVRGDEERPRGGYPGAPVEATGGLGLRLAADLEPRGLESRLGRVVARRVRIGRGAAGAGAASRAAPARTPPAAHP